MAHSPEETNLAQDEDKMILQQLGDTSKNISQARVEVEKIGAKTSTRLANRVDDLYDAAETGAVTAQSAVSSIKSVLETDAMKTVQHGIKTLVEGLPGVLKALDEVASIHPFLKIVVGAFRVVVELDKKRRDNEKKITLLFVEMKDMMEVLLQLRTIKDEDTPGLDGTTIKARLQELVKHSAGDIKDCANTCDTYSKEKLFVRVIKSSSWDDKFKGFLTLFEDRRKAFAFALEIHMGKQFSEAQRKLDAVSAKLDAIMSVFSALISPDQQHLESLIRSKGGVDAVLKDEDTLTSLLRFKSSSSSTGTTQQAPGLQFDIVRLGSDGRDELFETADAAIRKNLTTFERKFAMQERRITEELQGVVRHESDRIIDTVLEGPHSRIQDSWIREVWKDMRWRGHVKAREFILVLRDYYLQQIDESATRPSGDAASPISYDDKWALECLNVNYISPISEAFDDDASGFLTISEVNSFTSSRPQGWSLLHWLAFWAKGWRMSSTYYVRKIGSLLAEMFSLLPHTRAENRELIAWYLAGTWEVISPMESFDCTDVDLEDALWGRFQDYVEAEEKRLEDGLKSVCYYIDATDTLALITGPGRIERFLLPVLYLLVRRDRDILRFCHKEAIINCEELLRSAYSVYSISDAIQSRVSALEAVFKQRNLDTEKHFKVFAYGLYYQYHKPAAPREGPNFATVNYPRPAEKTPSSDPGELLNYACPSDGVYIRSRDTSSEADLRQPDGPLKTILGRWYGFFGEADAWPSTPMTTFFLHASGPDTFEARTQTARGYWFTISGTCALREDGVVECMSQWLIAGSTAPRFVRSTVSEDGLSMSGVWSDTEDGLAGSTNDVFFTRISQDALTMRPPPAQLRSQEGRTKALWRFALDATRLRVRRHTPSWRYLADFIQRWIAYLKLVAERKALRDVESPSADGLREIAARLAPVERTLTFDEACFCAMVLVIRERALTSGYGMDYGYLCDFCQNPLNVDRGARYTCLTCFTTRGDSLDLCDTPRCTTAAFASDAAAHRPAHDMIKVRELIVWQHELPRYLRLAKAAITRMDEMSPAAIRPHMETPVPRPSPSEAYGQMGSAGQNAVLATRKGAGLPHCAACSEQVRHPFFVCLDCADRGDADYVCICAACDEEVGGVAAGSHQRRHTLLRCLTPAERALPEGPEQVHERLRALEATVASYSERMARMERLLENISSALGPRQVPTTDDG